MNNLLFDKLEELFLKLDNCDEIKLMLIIKEQIKKDQELSELLNKYRTLDKYDPKFLEVKKQIIDNKLVKQYHSLENQLYLTVLETNNKLKTLIDKKRCNDENN